MTTTVVTVRRVEVATDHSRDGGGDGGVAVQTVVWDGRNLRLPETAGAGQSTAMIMYGDICEPV